MAGLDELRRLLQHAQRTRSPIAPVLQRIVSHVEQRQEPPPSAPPKRTGGGPAGPPAPPPSGVPGPTKAEIAKRKEAEAAARAAEAERKRKEAERKRKEEERKRKEAARRAAAEARRRAEMIKRAAEQKRQQIRRAAGSPSRPTMGPPAPTKKEPKPTPTPRMLPVSPVREVLEKIERAKKEPPRPGPTPTPAPFIGPRAPSRPTPAPPTPIERLKVTPAGRKVADVIEKARKPMLGPKKEPTAPTGIMKPRPPRKEVPKRPEVPTPIESRLMQIGPAGMTIGERMYEARTGEKPSAPFAGPRAPPEEKVTPTEALKSYEALRREIEERAEERGIRGIRLPTAEQLAGAKSRKEIKEQLENVGLTQKEISEVRKNYQIRLKEIQKAPEGAQFNIDGQILSKQDAINYLKENKPTYTIPAKSGVGYGIAAKEIDLTKPGAYKDIISGYAQSQEFIRGAQIRSAVSESVKETINTNPDLKYLINYYQNRDPSRVENIKRALEKDIESQYTYGPTTNISESLIKEAYEDLPQSKKAEYNIKYVYPEAEPEEVVGAPGSHKYFKQLPKKQIDKIVEDIYKQYKKGNLPEQLGPGGERFESLLEQKISGIEPKKYKEKRERQKKSLAYGGYGTILPSGQVALTAEGQRKFHDYLDELHEERLKKVLKKTLTTPEYTELFYEKLPVYQRIPMAISEAEQAVAMLPVTLGQAGVKALTGGKTLVLPDVAAEFQKRKSPGPRPVYGTLTQAAMGQLGLGEGVPERELEAIRKYPLEFFTGSITEAATLRGLSGVGKALRAPITSKIPTFSLKAQVQRGLRYGVPKLTGEFKRVFGPGLQRIGRLYKPITRLSGIREARSVLGKPRLTVSQYTRRFEPTVLTRAKQALQRPRYFETPAGRLAYRVSEKPLKVLPPSVREGISRGIQQFRKDWRIPTAEQVRKGYRAIAGQPVVSARPIPALRKTLETGYKRLTGLQRRVGVPIKETTIGGKYEFAPSEGGFFRTPAGFAKTVYRRGLGTKWISEKDYKKLLKLFEEGIKKKGSRIVSFKNKTYFVDKEGNIREAVGGIAEKETIKRAVMQPGVTIPSKKILPKITKEALKKSRAAAEGIMEKLEKRPVITGIDKYGRVVSTIPRGRPYTPPQVIRRGVQEVTERVKGLKGRLSPRAAVTEAYEETRRPIFREAPMGSQYYVGRGPPGLAQRTQQIIRRATPVTRKPSFAFPTTPGGDILRSVGRGVGYIAPRAAALGIGYRPSVYGRRRTPIRITEPTEIQRPGVRRIQQPALAVERMPERESIRGLLPGQIQPQILSTVPRTEEETQQEFLQEQELRQRLVPYTPAFPIETTITPAIPFPQLSEEEKRKRLGVRYPGEVGIRGYKERVYEVPDIWGVTRGRVKSAAGETKSIQPQKKSQFFSIVK